MLLKTVVIAVALAATCTAQAQSTPAKKELVAKVLLLQQPGIQLMARSLTERPAMQLMQQANMALQQLPPERRDAVARDIDADLRKFVEEATPIVRDRAIKLAPTTIGPLLEERFTEDELRQVIALLESPVNRKFQAMAGDMQKAIVEKLVAETRADVEAKARVMEQSVKARLTPPAGAAPAPAAAPRTPAKKP